MGLVRCAQEEDDADVDSNDGSICHENDDEVNDDLIESTLFVVATVDQEVRELVSMDSSVPLTVLAVSVAPSG